MFISAFLRLVKLIWGTRRPCETLFR